MFFGKCFMICCLLFLASAAPDATKKERDEISDDYYFGRQGGLRTRDEIKWQKETEYRPEEISQESKSDDAAEAPENNIATDQDQLDSIYAQRPALRHHIAHFCPNLDIARDCIRKCLKEGKPAFCGKDHVCYCGHSYNAHEKNDKIDVNKVYAQFHDMYEKYFGPENIKQSRGKKSKIHEIGRQSA